MFGIDTDAVEQWADRLASCGCNGCAVQLRLPYLLQAAVACGHLKSMMYSGIAL